jgi:hypothetical protein
VGLFPLPPLQSYCHRIIGVRALEFDAVPFPPGHASPKLESGKAGKNIMIEKPTEATGIMTAYFKRLSNLMPGAATSFDPTNGSHHPVTDAWIFCHVHIPPYI